MTLTGGRGPLELEQFKTLAAETLRRSTSADISEQKVQKAVDTLVKLVEKYKAEVDKKLPTEHFPRLYVSRVFMHKILYNTWDTHEAWARLINDKDAYKKFEELVITHSREQSYMAVQNQVLRGLQQKIADNPQEVWASILKEKPGPVKRSAVLF